MVQLLFGAKTDAFVGCGGGKVCAQIPEDPGVTVLWELSCVQTHRNHGITGLGWKTL